MYIYETDWNIGLALIHYHPPPFGDQSFRINVIKGQIAKERVRAVLENSGYRVYAFGYESLLSQLGYDVKNRPAVPQNDSNNRMRSTPDLLGYNDDESRQTYFIEVKSSAARLQEKPGFTSEISLGIKSTGMIQLL